MERIIPNVMKQGPEEVHSEEVAAVQPKKETSRFENVVEGQCPSCKQQMQLSMANGIPVHVCLQHSVVMPLRDPEAVGVL